MQYLLWPLSEQFQNKNGSILTNGKIYVYYRGRTALATTWSDEDGTVENPQPIILDDNGRAACYVNPAYYYTVVVCDFYGKELFSYDISLHDGVGTGDNNIEITSSDHSILIDKSSIIDGYRYDEKVNPEFVAEIAVSAVSDLIPHYWNNDRTVVIDDSSKEIKTDMQCVMIRQQINNSYYDYKYAKICETDLNILTWINEWMTTLQLSFQSNGAYYSGKSSGIFVLNCENYIQSSSTYVQRHEEDGKWLLFDKDNSSPQISKLYLYWRDDFTSQHYELWGEFNNLKYYEGVGVAALINCCLRNHLTSSLPIDQERNIWRFNPIGVESLKDSLPTNAGDLVKTFDPADADIKPIAEPDPGTFYATYVYNGPASGNTSFEDIKAAYDAGKSVYVNYKENTDSKDTEVYSLVLFRDTPIGRPDLSCFYFTNMRTGTNKTIYRFPSNWGKMSDQNFASSDSVWDLQHAIATDYQLLPIPSPSGTYAVYGYHLYKAREEITEDTSFDPTQWQEITVMDEVQSLIASSSGTTDVFIAKYVDTPVSSVFEAVDEGKFVWVSLGSDGHGPYLPMNVISTEVGGAKTNYVRFEGLYFYDYGQGNEGRQVLVTAANQTGWEGVTTTNIAPKELVLSTVSGASSILESEIQIVSAAVDSASGGNFLAIYQSTPASAVYDALDAGKNVVLSLSGDGSGVYFRPYLYNKGDSYSDSRAYFTGTLSWADNNITQGRVYLNGETWSIVEYTPLPSTDAVGTMISNTVSTVSSVLETEIQTVSSAIEGISGQNGVFIAEYGTTTFEEIGEAVADGKAVFGKGHPYNSDMLLPISSFTSPRPSIAIFSGIVGNYQYSIKLDGTTWSNDTIILAKNEDVVNADWDATSGKAEILNRPEIEPVSAGTGIEIVEVSGTMVISSTGGSNYEAGQYISIVNDQISATGLVDQSTYNTDSVKYESAYSTVESNSAIWNETQVNADWNATSGVAEILNKPEFTEVSAGQGITIENVDDTIIISSTGGGGDPQVNSDWTATSGVAEILNKPTLVPVSGGNGIQIEKVNGSILISSTGSTVPASGVFFAEYGVTTLAEVQAAMAEGKEVIAYRSAFEAVTEVSYAYMESSYNNDTYIIFAHDFITDRTHQRYKWELTSSGWTTTQIFDYTPAASGLAVVNDSQNVPTIIAKVDGTTININSAGQLEALGGSSTVHTSTNLRGDGSSSNPLDLNSVIDIGGYPQTSHHTYINDLGVVSGMNIAPEYYGWAITPQSGLTIRTKYDDEGTTGPNDYLIGRDIISLHGIESSAQIWNEAAAMDEYPVSAGPGISIEDVDDVTVFGADVHYLTQAVGNDETVIYNGNLPNLNESLNLTESWNNFKEIRVVGGKSTDNPQSHYYQTANLGPNRVAFYIDWAYNWMNQGYVKFQSTSDPKVWTYTANTYMWFTHTDTTMGIRQNDTATLNSGCNFKIVGIGRKGNT